jgi:NAD-dependent dihydropyrimidine dehydrogenase PreA subunit
MTYAIGKPGVDLMDRACVEECPVDCIYEGGRCLYIHPDECVDRGACEPACPVQAIDYQDEPPGELRSYLAEAAKIGPPGVDTPLVASLPPQDPRGA